MNLGKRAFFYVTRKRKRSLLIGAVLMTVALLVLLGLAILDAQKRESLELRGATGTSFTVSRNLATGELVSDEFGTYIEQEAISDSMIESIVAVDGIDSYNAGTTTILSLSNSNDEYLEHMDPVGYLWADIQYYSIGCIDSSYSTPFTSGVLSLIEGKMITSEQQNGVLISEDIAKKHHLGIGDEIQAVNNPKSDDPTIKLQIVGIFRVNYDKDDEKNMYNDASYFSYSNYTFVNQSAMKELVINYPDGDAIDSADFFVEDPEKLDQVITKVQSISSIDWNNYIITANDEVYQRTAGAMSNVSILIMSLIIAVIIISTGILILLLSMEMKHRKKEIGILMSIGESKGAIIGQCFLEMALIAFVAFPCMYLLSRLLTEPLKMMLGTSADTITISPQNYEIVLSGGIVVVLVSVLVACLPIMRFHPKTLINTID